MKNIQYMKFSHTKSFCYEWRKIVDRYTHRYTHRHTNKLLIVAQTKLESQ